jgi:hypothetical protein
MREKISELISNTCIIGFGAFIASARQIEFFEACIKSTDSLANRTITDGDVNTGMKSRMREWIIVKQRTFDRMGRDLMSAELNY